MKIHPQSGERQLNVCMNLAPDFDPAVLQSANVVLVFDTCRDFLRELWSKQFADGRVLRITASSAVRDEKTVQGDQHWILSNGASAEQVADEQLAFAGLESQQQHCQMEIEQIQQLIHAGFARADFALVRLVLQFVGGLQERFLVCFETGSAWQYLPRWLPVVRKKEGGRQRQWLFWLMRHAKRLDLTVVLQVDNSRQLPQPLQHFMRQVHIDWAFLGWTNDGERRIYRDQGDSGCTEFRVRRYRALSDALDLTLLEFAAIWECAVRHQEVHRWFLVINLRAAQLFQWQRTIFPQF